MNRKWLPSFAELIDRLSIHQLKEVFIPHDKAKYRAEMCDIIHDLSEMIKEKNICLTGEMIKCIIVLAQINTHIWYNERAVREGKEQDLNLLRLTHGLNGMRTKTGNKLLDFIGEGSQQITKVDCLAADFKDWEIELPE
tara:strand:- start:814 stop:1230 length:417 start_codon:yes stop_codon:yes gene_type:complete